MAEIKELQGRLTNGEVVILDGAIGTELQRMGVPMHDDAWCAMAMETHPDSVRQLHEDYIKAGAEIITTNTFSSARFVLEPSGHDDKTVEWNTSAVELAMRARDNVPSERPVYVAGSMSRYGARQGTTVDSLRSSYAEQARILAGGGVDLLLLEMLGGTVETITYALEAALETGLPTWLALSCAPDPDSGEVLLGIREVAGRSVGPTEGREPLGQAAGELMATGASALLIIHSQVEIIPSALDAVKAHWQGPLGAYPHSGHWVRPNWQFVNMISPGDYLSESRRWVEMGTQIVGGCCGIGIQHVELLRDGLPERV